MKIINFEDFNSIISELLSKKAWNVKIGYGSFLTMEFGEPVKNGDDSGTVHGEWYLWTYLCSWRIDKNDKFIVGSEDLKPKLESIASQLEGSVLEKFNIINAALDSELYFDNGMILRLFSVISEDEDGSSHHWKLFMPDNQILLAGPGSLLSIKESDKT